MLAHKLKNSTREQDWWMPDKTFRGQVHSSECWNQAQIIVHSTNKCSTTSWSCWKLVGPKLWEVWLKAQHRTLPKWSKKGLVAETKTKNPVRPLISAGGKVCLGVGGGGGNNLLVLWVPVWNHIVCCWVWNAGVLMIAFTVLVLFLCPSSFNCHDVVGVQHHELTNLYGV